MDLMWAKHALWKQSCSPPRSIQHYHKVLCPWHSSDNTILGRLCIHMMRAISSTHHELLKYPIQIKIARIIGDQAMARTIAIVVRKKSGLVTKTSRAVTEKDPLQTRNKRGLLTNNNHKAVKAKTLITLSNRRTQIPTHPTSRGTQTARPRRSPSLSL